jgi:hypothetical protein
VVEVVVVMVGGGGGEGGGVDVLLLLLQVELQKLSSVLHPMLSPTQLLITAEFPMVHVTPQCTPL